VSKPFFKKRKEEIAVLCIDLVQELIKNQRIFFFFFKVCKKSPANKQRKK
jgi:hypothetical protein